MTEDIQVTDVSATEVQDQASTETQVSSDISPVESQATPEVQAEKMIPQSQVNKIAAREARKAEEKAAERTRQQMMREFEERQTQSSSATPPNTQNLGGMNQMSPEDFERRLYEAAHKIAAKQAGEKIATDYERKINEAKDEDPEFAQAYDESGMANHPQLIIWTNELENTADTVKEMVKNPEKFAQIMMLAATGAHGMAKNALKRLSGSIKANVEAQNQPQVKEPLSQIKPTNIGIADNGSLSVSDFKNQPWLRG
jgi:hypothetical protein